MLHTRSICLSIVAVLAIVSLDGAAGQQARCFTQPSWTEFCSGVLREDGDDDAVASSVEYIAMLNSTAMEYGVQTRTTVDPPPLFYQLELEFQLPFVAHFCDSLVILQGAEKGKCYETLQSGPQTDEMFGFPISEESEPYLEQLCSDIYAPALEREWIMECPTVEEKDNEDDAGEDLVLEPTTEPVMETIERNNNGPIFIAIGASGGILVLFLGLMYARHRKEDDDEDFENASPVDGPDEEVAPETIDNSGADDSRDKEASTPVDQPNV